MVGPSVNNNLLEIPFRVEEETERINRCTEAGMRGSRGRQSRVKYTLKCSEWSAMLPDLPQLELTCHTVG